MGKALGTELWHPLWVVEEMAVVWLSEASLHCWMIKSRVGLEIITILGWVVRGQGTWEHMPEGRYYSKALMHMLCACYVMHITCYVHQRASAIYREKAQIIWLVDSIHPLSVVIQ